MAKSQYHVFTEGSKKIQQAKILENVKLIIIRNMHCSYVQTWLVVKCRTIIHLHSSKFPIMIGHQRPNNEPSIYVSTSLLLVPIAKYVFNCIFIYNTSLKCAYCHNIPFVCKLTIHTKLIS